MGAKKQQIVGAGIDLGSGKTRMALVLVDRGRVRLVGAGEVDSAGWAKGRIADQAAVTDNVLAALREAETTSGLSIEIAVVGMGGPTVRGTNVHGIHNWGYVREVEAADIDRAVSRARRRQLPEDCMILQLLLQDFVVDDHPGHTDPRKTLASCLEANVHLVTTSIQEHNALVGAVNQAHLNVEESIFEGMAASYAVVVPEDRRQGIAVVDIGSDSTELVVYNGEAMCQASSIPIGGDTFTADLAKALRLSPLEAEFVKRDYGRARYAECPENVWVELPVPEGREPAETRKRNVNLILESRAIDLFQQVRKELVRIGMQESLLGGVFLTGGGAKLPEILEVADRELECQSRFGLTLGVEGGPAEMKDREWCTALGLAMYSAKLKDHTRAQREAAGWLGRMLR
jgi:cell division protein FtsA